MDSLTKRLSADPELKAAYLARKVSVREIAERFGTTEAYVAVTLSRLKWKRPFDPLSRTQIEKRTAELTAVRTEFRAFMAEKVLKNQIPIERAAEICNCSERTIYRYVKELKLQKKRE